MKKKDEVCEPCNHQVAADMSLSVCSTIKDKIGVDCDQLHKDVKSGKVKPLAASKRLRDAAKKRGLPEASQLEDIYNLGRGK
jgi:hypothetical protein